MTPRGASPLETRCQRELSGLNLKLLLFHV